MNFDLLVDVELDRVNWERVQEASGPADAIPRHFRELLAANSEAEAKKAYWNIENHAVVQGHLYEAAIPLVPAICAALADPNRSLLVRTWLIELLFQICSGYYLATPNNNASPPDIVERCRTAARGALWMLYRELAKQEVKIVEDLIMLLESDPERMSIMRERIPNYKTPTWTTDAT